MNMITNARDAVSGNPKGQRLVTVDVSSNEQDVVLTVTDIGPGLYGGPCRFFDPFVTTKKNGLVMGLASAK